ncbi:GNAT family N-acetyltransferase [Nocardioides mesophilus]|uniref:GNAT family N-acetyltransferase n=1 Tax=Nocardioides mesophilus TaxID=433659 RepID=A0A7G9R804_9ACTN|nr:GNAT family N-acetyltransferase [Nocardioides mesophilus]QNN51729.1 GNAT family N-acetyltransferase [Nocardioides mesophilus]
MFRLVDPDPRFHRSFLEAADEFAAEGRPAYSGLVSLPAEDGFPGLRFSREDVADPAVFARYVEHLLAERLEETPRPAAYVPYTVRWIVDEHGYVGRISLRHRLTDLLLTWGGHIGYGVRPSARGRGAATYALAQMLPLCHARGIDPVLVTCDVDNEPSRRTIERNGGVYEDTRQGKLRYWVPTGPA